MYDVAVSAIKETKKIEAGKSLVLSVNTIGTPSPKASWWRNDSEIKYGLHVTAEGDDAFSRLTIKNTSADKTFMYKVVTENRAGSDSVEYNVVILGSFNSRHLAQTLNTTVLCRDNRNCVNPYQV